MNISSVRKLVEAKHGADVLKAAEEAILNGDMAIIEIEGEDEGACLTHVMAAHWVTLHIQEHKTDVMTAIREYTKKVRSSIS